MQIRPPFTSLILISLFACGDDVSSTDGDTGTTSGSTTQTQSTLTTTTATTATTTTTTTADTTSDVDSSSTATSLDDTTDASTTDGDSTGTATESTGSSSGSTDSSSGSTDSSSGSTDSSSGSTDSSTGTTGGGGMVEAPGFVGMSTTDALLVFDRATESMAAGPIDLLPEGNYPYDATIHPSGHAVWLVGASGGGVVVLDTETFDVVTRFTLSPTSPYSVDVLFSADGSVAYVANRNDDSLVSIDTATYAELEVIPTPNGREAGKMALNPCTGHIYVVEWYGDELMTYDPATDAWDIVDIGSASLWDLAVHPSGSTLYVTDRSNDVVHVFDVSQTGGLPVATPDASVSVGDDPWGIAITSDGSTVVVACEDDQSVHFIDTATLTASSLALPAGSQARDVEISIDDAAAYVPSGNLPGDDAVYVIDLSTQVHTSSITLTGAQNANVIAVSPQLVECLL